MPRIEYRRVVHLSHVIDERIPLWPGDPPVQLQSTADLKTDGYSLRRISMGEHSATHFNTPRTFSESGHGADEYEATPLIAPAVVIDCSDQAAKNADFRLGIEDVLAWEAKHGAIRSGDLVLLNSGWDCYWGDPDRFLGKSQTGLHFPGFGGDAVGFLLDERRIAGIGIDTHGVDGGQDQSFETNRLVLERGGIVLENLAGLAELPAVGATLVIGILRLREGTGSPVGVLGLIP